MIVRMVRALLNGLSRWNVSEEDYAGSLWRSNGISTPFRKGGAKVVIIEKGTLIPVRDEM